MADSDDEYDRKRRDKFRGERSAGDNYRTERRGDERRREDWPERNPFRGRGGRPEYRDYRGPRERYSPGRDLPPPKRMRGDWGDDRRYGGHDPYGMYGWTHDHYPMHGHGFGGHPPMPAHPREGPNNTDMQTQPAMMTLKQFLDTQDDTISDSEVLRKYSDYKLDFKRQQLNEFFVAHKDEEWFKNKYHPEESLKRKEEQSGFLQKRVDVFSELLEQGAITNVSVDTNQTDLLLRLLDTVVIKLEGGTDEDLKALDEKPQEYRPIEAKPFDFKRNDKDQDDDVIITEVKQNTKLDEELSWDVIPSKMLKKNNNNQAVEDEENWDCFDPVEPKKEACDDLGGEDWDSFEVVKPKKVVINDDDGENWDSDGCSSNKESSPQKRKRSSSRSSESSINSEKNVLHEEKEKEEREENRNTDDVDMKPVIVKVEEKEPEKEQEEEEENIGKENIEPNRKDDEDSVPEKILEETDIEKPTEKEVNENIESEDKQSNQEGEEKKIVDDNDGKEEGEEEEEGEEGVNKEKPQEPVIKEETETETIDLEKEKEPEGPVPRALHRTSSIFLRNLAPTITKAEIEAVCRRYDGFLRVAIADPLVERRWFRRGWVTFKRDVNIKEICWNLNNIRLRDCEMGAIVNRDLSRRVRPVNGITAHKVIVRSDIKLCAKIVLNLDDKYNLWIKLGDNIKEEAKTEVKKETFGFDSKNPTLQNITDFLIEEASAEEDELLGLSGDNKDGADGETIDRDPQLISVLDKLILYLRVVHSVDFYNHCEYPYEDEMPNRCGIIHARGPGPQNKITKTDIEDYIKNFECKMSSFLTKSAAINQDELKNLGCKDPEAEVEKFIQANTQELAKDKWLCPLSGKKFKGPEFIRKHIFNKHGEKVDEVRKEVEYFNNYLKDPKRPQLPEHPGNTRRQPADVPPQAPYRPGYPAPVYAPPYAAYAPPIIAPPRPRGFGNRRGPGGDYRPVIHYRDLDAPREPVDFL